MNRKQDPKVQQPERASTYPDQAGQKIQESIEDMVSPDPAVREQGERKFKENQMAETGNGHPPANDPGSHRRH